MRDQGWTVEAKEEELRLVGANWGRGSGGTVLLHLRPRGGPWTGGLVGR